MNARPNREEVLAQIDKASQFVSDLCHGRRRWTMSVPARPDEDPDLVISDALRSAREEIAFLHSLLNTPETEEFDDAVPLEAAHQILRWGTDHDGGKNPEDWFWLLGYLGGKALAAVKSGDIAKAKHHCISSAAALRNWHAHLRSGKTAMRPGIETPVNS